jgi:hypothetical protein
MLEKQMESEKPIFESTRAANTFVGAEKKIKFKTFEEFLRYKIHLYLNNAIDQQKGWYQTDEFDDNKQGEQEIVCWNEIKRSVLASFCDVALYIIQIIRLYTSLRRLL